MKKIHKILLTFLPLVIAILVWIIYFGGDYFILQEDSWFTMAAEPFKSIPVEQLNVDDN